MSLCEVRPQALQQIGGSISEEKLAIVPDIIQSFNFVSDLRGCKRYSSDSDCLSFENFEELLNGDQQQLDFSFKRHCDYSISPSPDQFQSEVKDSYDFGVGKDSKIFTCGENSPVSSSPVTDFTTTSTQNSASCQQTFDLQAFASVDFFPNMQRQSHSVLSHQVTPAPVENYELVITEQPEEVST